MDLIRRELSYCNWENHYKTPSDIGRFFEMEKGYQTRIFAVASFAIGNVFISLLHIAKIGVKRVSFSFTFTTVIIDCFAIALLFRYHTQKKRNVLDPTVSNYKKLCLEYVAEESIKTAVADDIDGIFKEKLFRLLKREDYFIAERRVHIQMKVNRHTAYKFMKACVMNNYTVTFDKIDCSRWEYLFMVIDLVKKFGKSDLSTEHNRLQVQLDHISGNFTPKLNDDDCYSQKKPTFAFSVEEGRKTIDISHLKKIVIGENRIEYQNCDSLKLRLNALVKHKIFYRFSPITRADLSPFSGL